MPATCRLNQKITGNEQWKQSGQVIPGKGPFTGTVSDPTVASIQVFVDGSFEVDPKAAGTVTVTVTDANGNTASDSLTVTSDPVTGTITWSAPFPA